ncbi:ABC transporter permease [Paenibacillus sp. FSL K6-2524]|uniref:ABC transporter permease n=1 Tax=Paenibacillus sp. FSL K6-2524 TaxID=2954516 RepID=UPI0030F580AD
MKYKKIIFIVIAVILMFLYYNMFISYQKSESKLSFQFQLNADQADDYQLFYITKEGQEWSEEQSFHQAYDQSGTWQTIKYNIPKDVYSLRLDLGNQKAIVNIRNIKLVGNSKVSISLNDIMNQHHDIKIISMMDQKSELQATDKDPYLVLDIKPIHDAAVNGINPLKVILGSFASIITTLVSLYILNSIKDLYRFLIEIYRGRHLIFSLAKNDFKTKYASSYLGIVWGFIQPLLTIITYWFVFQVGLRSGSVSDVPFILWFIVAIIPWFFFSEALSGATNVYSEYSYLVKKVVFKIELLPVVKITSALFVHLFFILFIFVMYTGYGYYPNIHNVQLLYYLICTIALTFSLSLITSAIVIFFKDLNQIIIIVLQIGFWFTPIGWSYTMLSDFWSNIFKLNPMFYIVEGYRDTFIRQVTFLDHPYYTFYFWMFCIAALVIGVKSFKKLKPHFADVI